MPAASVCDPVTVTLQRTFESSSAIDDTTVDISLSSSRILHSEVVEYEESEDYRRLSTFDRLKSKYSVVSVPSTESSDDRNPLDNVVHSKKGESTPSVPTLPEPVVTLYPAHKVRLGWKNDFPVGAGMFNVGNTCYLNSTLQALFHVPALVNWLLYDSNHRVKCEQNDGVAECLICAMAKTLQFSHQKSDDVIRPFYIYNKLKSICRTMVFGQQEDAHEFLRYLLEGMERAYLATHQSRGVKLDSYSKETTPVNQIFGGYIRTEVKCLQCRHVSTTFQHFQDLLVDIRKATTLNEALSSYFSQEQLDNNDYKCEACKRRVPATKQFSLEKPPKVLCVQLKRFSVLGGKIQRHIGFKQTVDMGPYLWKESGEPRKKLTYRLTSMVTHMGPNVNCGHYTAVAQVSSGKYYCFDDACVRPVSLSNVLNTNAYIMFFEMEPHSENGALTTVMPKMNGAISTKSNSTLTNNTPTKHLNSKPILISNSKNKEPLNSVSQNNSKNGSPRQNFIGPQLPRHMTLDNGKTPCNGNSLVPYDGSSDEEEVVCSNKCSNGKTTTNGSDAPKISSPKVELARFHNSIRDDPKSKNNGSSSTSRDSKACLENGDLFKSEKSCPSNSEKINNGTINGSSESEDVKVINVIEKWNGGYKNRIKTNYEERVSTKAPGSSKNWHVSTDASESQSASSGGLNGWTESNRDDSKKSSNHVSTLHAAATRTFDGTNRSDTVDRLTKLSHRGYGDSTVKSWSGNTSHLAREVDNESRFERKRHLYDEDLELDKGRVKKIKTSHERSFERPNPGRYYNNHFQRAQSNKNWNQRPQFYNKNYHKFNHRRQDKTYYNKKNNYQSNYRHQR